MGKGIVMNHPLHQRCLRVSSLFFLPSLSEGELDLAGSEGSSSGVAAPFPRLFATSLISLQVQDREIQTTHEPIGAMSFVNDSVFFAAC